MEKTINEFVFVNGEKVNRVICSLVKDSEKQENLICDLYFDEVVDGAMSSKTVYQGAAYELGSQPFELTEEEIEELRGL